MNQTNGGHFSNLVSGKSYTINHICHIKFSFVYTRTRLSEMKCEENLGIAQWVRH